jgi:glycosyltransferase involved in cell wall biosynthesis
MSVQGNSNPKVSVVIPVYNRDKEILDVIKSLNLQSYQNFEAIFVDDYSTVPLSVTLQKHQDQIKFEFKLHRNKENFGVSRTRNEGVKLAEGDYICFLDSDDEWFPNKIKDNVQQCLSLTGSVFAMSKTHVVKEGYIETLPENDLSEYSCGEEYLFEHGNFAQVSSFFLSKSLAEKIRFNESLAQYEDFLYFIEAFNAAEKVVFIDQILVKWNDIQTKGRLSLDKNYKQSSIFINEVTGIIDTRYLECFYLRFVLPYYFYHNIYKSLRTIYYCLFKSSISSKTVLWMALKGILGNKLIAKIRSIVKT